MAACESHEDAALVERSWLSAQPIFEGRFETRIARMLDGTSRTTHHLVDAPHETELVLDPSMHIPRDAVVQIWGDEVEADVIEVDRFEIVSLPPQPLIDPEARPHRRIATVLLEWEGATQMNNPTARDRMFLGAESTNVFYGENSYGIDKMAGNVFGPYKIPKPESCNSTFIAAEGMKAFEERGHRADDYRQFMWVFPSLPGCGWSGLGSMGTPDFPARDSWYNGSFGCVVRNQEIGHNFGMGHSRSYTGCTNADGEAVPFSDNCNDIEYGDPFDPMGNGCAHMNVVQKTYMGWLDGCNIVTATADATFNLLPTELPCEGTQALRFPTYDGRHYWLEYRQPLSIDDGLSGVLVHVAQDVGGSPRPYILRMSPTWYLQEGQSYTDPEGTVTFTVVEQHPTHAVISATFPEGGSGAPTCKGEESPVQEAGAIGTLQCAEEPFPLDITLPTVKIVYPADGDRFAPGSSFTIMAEAIDDRSVTELELYLGQDGEPAKKLFSSFDAPWTWEVEDIPEGRYELGVVAWDGPNSAPSNAVVIHVSDEAPAQDTGSGSETGEPIGTTGTASGSESGGGDEAAQEATAEQGCGCQQSEQRPTAAALALLALLGVRRRNARRRKAR